MSKLIPGRATVIKPRFAGLALCVSLVTGVSLAVQLPRAALAAAPGVTLSGNQFLLAGQPFVPHGFNSIALLNSAWCTSKSTAAAASNLGSAELNAAMNTWNANTLRFQVSQPVLAGPNGAAYAQQVQSGADLALNAGFAVDISMQDQSLACGPGEPLPSQETETAWATLIGNTTLADNPSVMFELFNEPQNSPATTPATDPGQETWADWLNGGRPIQPTSSEHWLAYTPVGHQDLVTYLRTTLNVTNVLIADGASSAEHLEGMPILSDPGSSYQIAYAVHPYFYTPGLSAWNTRWGYLTSTNAVIATEWNYTASDCRTSAQTIAPQFLGYMRNTVNVGILGQALDDFGSGHLVADTGLDPTQCGTASPGGGYDFLHDYMDTFSPAPAVPTGLQLTLAAKSINLTWNAVTDNAGVTGYDVYRNGSLLATAAGPSYSDTTVVPGTTYTYAVAAFDAAGNVSAPSATESMAFSDTTPPTQPTKLALTPATTSIALKWTASTDNVGVSGYRIYRGSTLIATVKGNVTTYTSTGLKANTTYSYHLVAFDAAGNLSKASATVSAKTK